MTIRQDYFLKNLIRGSYTENKECKTVGWLVLLHGNSFFSYFSKVRHFSCKYRVSSNKWTLPNYITRAEREKRWIHPFLKEVRAKYHHFMKFVGGGNIMPYKYSNKFWFAYNIYIYIYILSLRKTTKPVTKDYKFISILLCIFEISKNTKKKN